MSEVELLHNRYVVFYQFFGDLEVVSLDAELDQFFLDFLQSPALRLRISNIVHIFYFFLLLFLPFWSSLLHIFDLLRNLIDMHVIDFLYRHFLHFLQKLIHNETDFLSGEKKVLSIHQRKPDFACMLHVLHDLSL